MFEPREISRGHTNRMKFRFQLTSLMDLLLIIVFAQFMEIRSASDAAKLETLAAIEDQKNELAQNYARAVDELAETEQQLEARNNELRAERDRALAIAESASTQTKRMTEAVVDILAESNASFAADQSSQSAQDLVASADQLRERFAELDGADALRFLVGYEELLKRAEVWTLHVSDRGDITLSNGRQEASFRLESATQSERTEEFIRQLRSASSQFPQPKGIVVVLVSYSPLAIAGNYQPVLDGTPRAMQLLSIDAEDRSRFESAIIGAVIDPDQDLPRPELEPVGPSTREEQ